jgi:hypothetical protein
MRTGGEDNSSMKFWAWDKKNLPSITHREQKPLFLQIFFPALLIHPHRSAVFGTSFRRFRRTKCEMESTSRTCKERQSNCDQSKKEAADESEKLTF